ncbi:hypothetical protein [Nonomuraea sp. NPDC050310]|uniref:hypothetical protein n=1 Tax=Nonomuraea sp. NPDC050310 TaxID=3154935 RepID=UPI0033FFE621
MANPPSTDISKTTTEYAWVMTLQWPSGAGFGTSTTFGKYDAIPGTSRLEAYKSIYSLCCAQAGIAHGRGTVMFWSMETELL